MNNVIYKNDNNRVGNIVISNATIKYKNFAGKGTKFNRPGDRNFCVVIDDAEIAQTLAADGWNVKIRAPKEEGDKPEYILQVKVAFNAYPPEVNMYTKKRAAKLNEDTIEQLDYVVFEKVDLTIRPYSYEVSGRSGISAYLKYLHVTIEEDFHASDYDRYYTPNDEMPF